MHDSTRAEVQQLSVPSFYPYISLSWLGPWPPACREKKYDGLRLQLPAGPASVAAVVAVAEAVALAEAVVVAEVVLVDEAVVVVEELVLDEEVVLDEAVVAVQHFQTRWQLLQQYQQRC